MHIDVARLILEKRQRYSLSGTKCETEKGGIRKGYLLLRNLNDF